MVRIAAERISRWVDDRLAGSGRGVTVASVFRRVANLRLDSGECFCLSAADLPLAANGVAIGVAAAVALPALGLQAGQSATIDRRALVLREAEVEIRLGGAVRWEPRPGIRRVSRGELAPRAREALTVAVAEGDSRSLLPLLWMSDRTGVARGPAAASAHPASALRLAAAAVDAPGVERAARRLAGLGPGLTPSGDDYLAGFAAALALGCDSLGLEPGSRGRVLDALCAGAAPGASDLGRAWISHAARGEVAEPMARFFSTLLGPAPSGGLAASVRGVLALGATSGADWMTGALAGTDAILAMAARADAWS